MKKLYVIIICFLIVSLTNAQYYYDDTPEKPPLKPGKTAAEFVAGTLAGFGFGFGGGLIGGKLAGGDGWDQLAGGLLGFAIGYPVGAAAGVHLVGNTQNEKGSFGAAVGGGLAGAGLAIIIIVAIDNPSVPYIYLALPPIGAIVGHNLSRRWEVEPGSALLNFKEGKFSGGVPSLELRRHPRKKHEYLKQFRLLSVSF